jgi:hypothetical protein
MESIAQRICGFYTSGSRHFLVQHLPSRKINPALSHELVLSTIQNKLIFCVLSDAWRGMCGWLRAWQISASKLLFLLLEI